MNTDSALLARLPKDGVTALVLMKPDLADDASYECRTMSVAIGLVAYKPHVWIVFATSDLAPAGRTDDLYLERASIW
ncbi:hypothetical protein [Xanthomonas arboricola]|uniref:hypothetical protein n=1 Tax=Xanthomonas arboricola TaxID=56448 RepID=UPI0011B0E6FA|nr:hypothetical protein [Xanthomonas arboricola]